MWDCGAMEVVHFRGAYFGSLRTNSPTLTCNRPARVRYGLEMGVRVGADDFRDYMIFLRLQSHTSHEMGVGISAGTVWMALVASEKQKAFKRSSASRINP